MGIVSHITDGLAHLGDGRRQLLALGPLLLQVGVYGLDMPPVILRRLQDLLVGVRAATHHGAQLRLLHAQQQFKGGQAVLTPGIEYLAKGAALLLARHGQQSGQPPLQMPAMPHLGQQAEQGDDSPPRLAGDQTGPHAEQGGAREQQTQLPRLQGQPGQPGQCLAVTDPGIELLCPGDVVILGTGADRLVFDDLLLIVENRRDVGVDPVELTTLGAVLYQPHPALALLQAAPHVGERGLGHVGVADQIVGLPFHFGRAVARHIAKVLVGISDVTGGIRGRDQ